MKLMAAIAIIAAATAGPAAAQHADHAHDAGTTRTAPAETGNAIFAAIAEVVRLLDADPATDWSRVNIEALRQHLIDMHDVMSNADVTEENVAGGLRIEVTGAGRTTAAIRRMTTAHAGQPDLTPGVEVSVEEIPGGTRLRVTAGDPSDVARIRALGFAGLLVAGAHHGPHHIAMARGAHRH